MVLEQVAELQDRGLVAYRLDRGIEVREAALQRNIEQRLFHGRIGVGEPLLHKMDPKHRLQRDGSAALAGIGIVRLDQGH